MRFDAIAELAFQGTADYSDASVKTARQAIASNLKRYEGLVCGDGGRISLARTPRGRSSPAGIASQWQRKWLDVAARTQVEMIQLLELLAADWSSLTSGPFMPQPRLEPPVGIVLVSMSRLFDSVLHSWCAVFGAFIEAADSSPVRNDRRDQATEV